VGGEAAADAVAAVLSNLSLQQPGHIRDAHSSGSDTRGGAGAGGGAPGGASGDAHADLQRALLGEVVCKEAGASCKSNFVLRLLDSLAAAGHRTLVFSQSRVMLDILQVCVPVWIRVCLHRVCLWPRRGTLRGADETTAD
jgi:hypothetical protein